MVTVRVPDSEVLWLCRRHLASSGEQQCRRRQQRQTGPIIIGIVILVWHQRIQGWDDLRAAIE
jgi:hypothetical protein